MSRWFTFRCVFVVLALVSFVQSESQSQTGSCDASANASDSAVDSLSTLESTHVVLLQLGTESHYYRTNTTENTSDSLDVGSARQLAAVSTPDHVLERRRIGHAVEEGTATHEDVASYARLYQLEVSRRKVLYLLHISKTAGTFFCACGLTQGCKAIQSENCHVQYDMYLWFPEERPGPRMLISTRPNSCESLAADYETRGLTLEANENFLPSQGLCHQFWNVIIVRDPLSRLFSHLSMFWEKGITEYNPSTITVEQVFKIAPTISNNYYIRSLLGHDIYMSPFGAIRRTHLERAKQRLRTFDVILMQQEHNDSVLTADINRRIGWSCQGDEVEQLPTSSMATLWGGGTASYKETLRAHWSDADWEYLVAQNMLDTELKQYADKLERLDRHVFDHGAFMNTISSRPKAGCGFLSS